MILVGYLIFDFGLLAVVESVDKLMGQIKRFKKDWEEQVKRHPTIDHKDLMQLVKDEMKGEPKTR